MRDTRLRGVVLALGLLAALAALADGQPRPVDASMPIYLVPIGAFPAERVDELVAHYRAKLGLTIRKLPPLNLERTALDYDRQQLIAEEVVAGMRQRLAGTVGGGRAVVIGLVSYDLYIRAHTWQWAFSFRADDGLAVVSIARMDPTNWGEAASAELLRARLRKMVSKNLGIMYYGLPQSTTRSSVLYGPILGVDDLDRIGEDF